MSGLAVRVRDDSPLATQLEHELSTASGVTRWLLWLDALEKAVPADFPRLMRLAKNNPAALRLVKSRWIERAPRHLFDLLFPPGGRDFGRDENDLAESLFEEWPAQDPDAAVAALNEDRNSGLLHRWGWTVAYSIVDKDVERGFRLMAEWHTDEVGFGPRGLRAVAKWAAADPRHAAEFILRQPDGYSAQSVVETIGAEWSKTDPAGALAFTTNHPGRMASSLASAVLREWLVHNRDQAAEWLAHADERSRNQLSPTFMEGWAKHDPEGALRWSEENLSGRALAVSVAGVVRGLAEKDIPAAAALVNGLAPSQARSEAALAVAQKWFPDLSSGRATIPAQVAWLAGLDSDSLKQVLNRITWGWATSDPSSMAAFLVRANPAEVPAFSYSIAARELARRQPAAALEWAALLPAQQALAAGSAAFTEWRSSQREPAMQWLADLKPEDPRRQRFLEDAYRGLAYHPQAGDQIANMSPADRLAARKVIQSLEITESERRRVLDLLGGP